MPNRSAWRSIPFLARRVGKHFCRAVYCAAWKGLPSVSVIIPAYNEARDLPRCLATLLDQTHRAMEIIVVDDGSTDGTGDLARGFGGVTVIAGAHAGSGAARNTGAAMATGDVLVFVDADMYFARDFLARLVTPIAAGAIGSFHETEYVANIGVRWARLWNVNQRLPVTRKHPPDYPRAQAVFRAVRRDAFLAVGGFLPGGYDDDLSLATRLHALAVVAPGCCLLAYQPCVPRRGLPAGTLDRRECNRTPYPARVLALLPPEPTRQRLARPRPPRRACPATLSPRLRRGHLRRYAPRPPPSPQAK